MKTETTKTIYHSGAFGITKLEAKVIDFGTKKYAQYDNAPYVHFIRKGKRKPEGLTQGYATYIVILEGVGHPTPADPFTKPVTNEYGVTIKQTVYTSFGEGYKTDFDTVLNEYLANNPGLILMDYRHTQNTKTINK